MNVLQSIEAVGSSIEDAIGRGLEALNVNRRDVDIEILAAPAGREARVRLTIKSGVTPAPLVSATPSETASAEEPPSTDSPNADAETARQVLVALLKHMRIDAEVEARLVETISDQDRETGPTLVLDIHGDELGGLIGRRGETLEDLQYLTRLLVAKEVGHYFNLIIDVEGYKSHREQMLQQLAQRMAERVTTSHKPATLEPMPANERRIIHLTLRDHPHVRTESIGSGDNRKVTIVPKTSKK